MQQNTVAPWALALSLVSLGLAEPGGHPVRPAGGAGVPHSRRHGRGPLPPDPGPLARTGFSVTAIICSLIALVISALLWAVVLFYLGMTELPECWGSDPIARQECIDAIRGTP